MDKWDDFDISKVANIRDKLIDLIPQLSETEAKKVVHYINTFKN